jgi:hypothetical protein
MEAVVLSPYRLKVRLGSHEFESEGSEPTVKEQFQLFLNAVNLAPAIHAPNGCANGSNANDSDGNVVDDDSHDEDLESAWSRAYKRDGDQLSLHVLPQTKFANADALILLIYGYQTLLKQESVKSTEVMEAAKMSGLRVDRIERNLPNSHSVFVIKGGNGKGSRYTLNNRGLTYAQELLETMFE